MDIIEDKATETVTATRTGTETAMTTTGTSALGASTPRPTRKINAHALLDSGSLAGNCISQYTLMVSGGIGREYVTPEPPRVCSGQDNVCYKSTQVVDVVCSFIKSNVKHSIVMTCRISHQGKFNLLIGRRSIKDHNLVNIAPRFFFDEKKIDKDIATCHMGQTNIVNHTLLLILLQPSQQRLQP